MLLLQNVQKKYNGRLILSVPAFEINSGIHWIAGINGSGKTTLLKIISGVIPFEGDVTLNGMDLRSHPVDYRKHVSFAEAEPLYPSFITGNDLVMFFSKIRDASNDEIELLTNHAGLGAALHNPVGTYSSGMVKRLSLLLAFIGHPQMILLDEPFATLDVDAIDALPNLIYNYREKYNTTFIFSSHQALPQQLKIDNRYVVANNTIHPA